MAQINSDHVACTVIYIIIGLWDYRSHSAWEKGVGIAGVPEKDCKQVSVIMFLALSLTNSTQSLRLHKSA